MEPYFLDTYDLQMQQSEGEMENGLSIQFLFEKFAIFFCHCKVDTKDRKYGTFVVYGSQQDYCLVPYQYHTNNMPFRDAVNALYGLSYTMYLKHC